MAGRLRVRLEPRTQTTQKLSTKLIKYAGISIGVVAFISGIIIIYSNLVESEDTFAKGSSSAYADKALQFDGDNDYVNLGSVNGNFSDQFTVMSWVKWNVAPSTGNPWANIFTINSSKEADEGIFWLQHTSDNSRFEFAVESSKGRNYVQSTIQPVKDIWYHVAGVYNGSTLKLYINGVLEGTVNHSGSIPKPKKDYEVTVGQWAYSGDQYRRFSGVIDEVSAWDYAMNPSDIRKYMTSKVPEKEKNLIMNFPFDEGSGKNAGSTNNSKYKGSIAGASWVDSGAPISSETSYQVKNNQKKYSHTFSNGYTLELNNMSKDPEAVYFYFIEDNADVSLEFNYTEYIFPTGIMGAYVIDRETVVYDAKFFVASKANSTGRTEQGKPIVLTRNSTTGQIWSTQDNVESTSLFTLNISSSQLETAIGEPSMALPIVLEYFKGRSAGQEGIELEWVTTMEENNDFFTIERSADGQNFDIIEKIPGAGNSKARLHYTTIDTKPLAGSNYYRLKQTDYDGKFEYSNIINVYGDKKETSGFAIEKVYPNPFIDKLNVDLVATEGPVIVTFANAGGNIVQQESFNASGGHDSFEIVASSRLEKGIYLVTFMQSGHEPKVIRVMKN